MGVGMEGTIGDDETEYSVMRKRKGTIVLE